MRWSESRIAESKIWVLVFVSSILYAACSVDGTGVVDEAASSPSSTAFAVPPADGQEPPPAIVDYSNQDLQGRVFTEQDLLRARFWMADLTGATFQSSDLRFADFWGATLDRAEFIDSDLTSARLYGASLTGTLFDATELRYASFYSTNIEDAVFEDSPLCMVTLPKGESSGEC